MFLSAGFNEVKMWFQPSHILFKDGAEFAETYLSFRDKPAYDDLEVRNEVIRLFDTKHKETLDTLEVLIILAYKDK